MKNKENALKAHQDKRRTIALAGNPNVGKSTVFNALTGMHQHTGNWPGKTVVTARGSYSYKGKTNSIVDLPGTYSLHAHSAEEEVARDFICFGGADLVVVVCDATCVERNLNLVLQTAEITSEVIVCLNLCDEARKKGIEIDVEKLEKELSLPVIACSARSGKGLQALREAIEESLEKHTTNAPCKIRYAAEIERAIDALTPKIALKNGKISARFVAVKLLEDEREVIDKIASECGLALSAKLLEATENAKAQLLLSGITSESLRDKIVAATIFCAEGISAEAVRFKREKYCKTDRRIDRILTSKWSGIPIMLALLALVFYITIIGANYPSELLASGFAALEPHLLNALAALHIPPLINEMLVLGVFRVLGWVVAVMLPPMAIFFPLFTLLEDLGYLPRIAFNLDSYFKRCRACGKQALTMCMGFGCNAVGVIGARIIDSPRERLIAIITNSFVPCNGRFPTLISIITMFFIAGAGGWQAPLSALILTAVILFSVLMTFAASKLLSVTLLKGQPSSFTLELPPYRKPQIGKVIVRSIFDRTLFVLARAATLAAPAGLIIWLFANITVGDMSVLQHCAGFLDPFARFFGMDGVILLAFILGFPANEIVLPIMIMAYLAKGSLTDLSSLSALRELLISNGWTWITAVSVMLFSLMHWPCSTTCLTIKKETQSLKWTAVSFLTPTLAGFLTCFVFNSLAKIII